MAVPTSYSQCSHIAQTLAVEPAYFDEDAMYEMHMATSSHVFMREDEWARKAYYCCDSDDEEDDERVPPSAASAFHFAQSYQQGSHCELTTQPCVLPASRRGEYVPEEDEDVSAAPAPAPTPCVPVAPAHVARHSDHRDADRHSESALSSVESEYELEYGDAEEEAEVQVLDYVLTAAADETEQTASLVDTKQRWLEQLEPITEPALFSMNMAPDPETHAQSLLAARFMDNTYTHYSFATAAAAGDNAQLVIELGVREMFGVPASQDTSEIWSIAQAVFDMTKNFRTAAESANVQSIMQLLVHLVQKERDVKPTIVREIAGYALALADIMRVVVPQAFPSSEGESALGMGESSPHVLGVMMHFTQYFLLNYSDVMRPIFDTPLPIKAVVPMERMVAPMTAQVARDCEAVRDKEFNDSTPAERGTMHPVFGLWERIHSLHVPIEYHDTFAPWLHQYCAWVSTFLKETNPKEHFAGRLFETKTEFFRSAAELWFMILRKMPLAYSELSEITSALSEYLPSQHGRKIIDYAKEHFDAQKMSMLPEKMGRMTEFVGVLDRKPDDGDKQGVQHVALKAFVASRFFTMQMKALIAQCPNDFYRLSQTKFKHVARAANSERFKDVAQLRANRRHRKRRA